MNVPKPAINPSEISAILRDISTGSGDAATLRPEIKSEVLRFLAQAGALAGAGKLASLPAIELNIGGGALFACGLIVADLQTMGGEGPAVKAAKAVFGDVPSALKILGVTACASLGGGSFYRMVKDGGVANPKDPRWLIVAANAGPYLAGSLMDHPPAKAWVEKQFGRTLRLAYRDQGQRRIMTVDSAPFYQQLAFMMGAAHILAFGIITKDTATSLIGTSFLANPMVAAGNMPVSTSQGEKQVMSRRGFFSNVSRLAVRPVLSGDGQLLYDNVMALAGMGRNQYER